MEQLTRNRVQESNKFQCCRLGCNL